MGTSHLLILVSLAAALGYTQANVFDKRLQPLSSSGRRFGGSSSGWPPVVVSRRYVVGNKPFWKKPFVRPILGRPTDFSRIYSKRLDEALLKKRQWKVGGSFNRGPGGNSWGLEGSRTWKHRNGGSTSLGGTFNRGRGGNSYGLKLSHTFGKRDGRRSVEA